MITDAHTKAVLSEVEAAKYLCVSRSFLAQSRMAKNAPSRTVKEGPPYVRMGRRIGYVIAELDKWLQKKGVANE